MANYNPVKNQTRRDKQTNVNLVGGGGGDRDKQTNVNLVGVVVIEVVTKWYYLDFAVPISGDLELSVGECWEAEAEAHIWESLTSVYCHRKAPEIVDVWVGAVVSCLMGLAEFWEWACPPLSNALHVLIPK